MLQDVAVMSCLLLHVRMTARAVSWSAAYGIGCVCNKNRLFLLDSCHTGNLGSLDLLVCNEHCTDHDIDAGSLQCVFVSTPVLKSYS